MRIKQLHIVAGMLWVIPSAESFCETTPKEVQQLERNKGGGRNAFVL
ncbi:hypothetical protein Nmel_007800, partial [Mimus melanotis]